MGPSDETWLTVDEAAAALGLHPNSVRRLIMEGGPMKSRKVGKRVNIISLAEVERYRQEHLGQGAWKTRKKPADEGDAPNVE